MDICVIGSGNVACHLTQAFRQHSENDCNTVVDCINPRTLENLPDSADVYLIAVSDRAIESVANRMRDVNGIVAHTSGSVNIEVLNGIGSAQGVFYPLQTFSKDSAIDYSGIPVFVEGSDPMAVESLKKTAGLFTGKIFTADSKLRSQLHLAAVFACNFTNRLFDIADTLLRQSGLDLDVVMPLIRQTIEKIEKLPPHLSQTGPAQRGDLSICRKHLDMLADNKEFQRIYAIMTESIMKDHNKL